MFVVFIKKEDVNSRFNSIEYRDNERDLNFIARMSELNIIINSKNFMKLNLFMLLKIMLRFFYFHNKRFLN